MLLHSSRLPAAWLVLMIALSYPACRWQSDGYSTGGPDSACVSMKPNHGNIKPQTSQPPFQITPGGPSVDGQKKITVTLATATPTGKFKGFYLQARDANTSVPIGTFVTDEYKFLTCVPGFKNTVTHSGASPKQSVVLEWAAPANYAGDVAFVATVVQEYNTFWTEITSEKVTVKRSAPAEVPTTKAPTTTLAPENRPNTNAEDVSGSELSTSPTAAAVTAATPAPKDASRGTTRRRGLLNSFRGRTNAPTPAPSTTTTTPNIRTAGSGGPLTGALANVYLDCNVNKGCFGIPQGCDGNCDSLFTYSKTSDGYQFELMGNVNGGNAYVAGGLSFDEDMGADSVMACRSYNDIADVTMTWNVENGKTNSFLADQKLGLSNYEMKQVDGKLYCRFNRRTVTNIEGKQFDLDAEKFYVMVAQGPLSADGSLSYHTQRKVSGKSTRLSVFKVLEGSSRLYVTLHASFMLAAWVGAASSGMLLARYFKQTWKNYQMCGIDQWFHFHRFFMVSTWSLTIAGFVLMLIQLEGWTAIPASVNPHAYIGIVSIALCFIQPFMAMCRCGATDSRRPVFNWLHWFVGNAAQILGITAIFFGLELYGMPRWTWWLMIGFVGFLCLIHVILSIAECVSDSKAKNQVSGFPMKELNSSRDMLQPPQDKILDAPGGTFRKAILALFLVVVWVLVIILLMVIILGEDQLKEWGLIFWE